VNLWRRLRRSRDPRSTPVLAALAAARIAVPPLHFVDADPPGTGRGVWAFHAPADQLLPWWHRLRTAHHVTKLWPVILGPHTELGEVWVTTEDPDDVVAAGLAMDATAMLAQRRTDVQPYPAYDSGVDVRPAPRGDATGLGAQEADDFSLAEEDGWLGLVAAPHGYVVPGLLSWSGAANVNLDGADQVAILKRWHDRFGAELVALGFDILELYVPRPPTDAETALAVAEEQWVYCPDAVDQGARDLDTLAAVQVRSHRWSFWWD
jgi:hypothetical protein